jgi:hypothetical protein
MRARSRITLASIFVALTALTAFGIAVGPTASADTSAPALVAAPGGSDLGIRSLDFRFLSPDQATWTVEVENFGPSAQNPNPENSEGPGYVVQFSSPSGATCVSPPGCTITGPPWQAVLPNPSLNRTFTFFLSGVANEDSLVAVLVPHSATDQGANTHPDSVSLTA